MIRYAVQMRKPGTILPVGLCEKAVANTGTKTELVLYVQKANQVAFEKMAHGHPDVLSYSARSLDLAGCLAEGRPVEKREAVGARPTDGKDEPSPKSLRRRGPSNAPMLRPKSER